MSSLTIASAFALFLTVIANQDLELFNAAAEGDLNLVNKALAAGANPNWQSPGGSWPMATALIKASAKNYVDIVSALLNANADPNLQEYRGVTALNEAAYHGSVDVVPILISYGADVNAYGANTPLRRTIHLNQMDIARVLLHHGADPNIKDEQGKTVANRAREKGHYQLANLIDNFDINTVTAAITVPKPIQSPPSVRPITMNVSSSTASQGDKDLELFNAAKDGDLPLLKFALALGANYNWQNQAMNGKTALLIASQKNYADIVLALLAVGAGPNLRDKLGNGPIHGAAYYGSADVLQILISYGADVNLKNMDGFTPLHKTAHIECAGHWIETAQILLQNGADRNLKDMKGITASGLARSRGFIKLANFIDNFDLDSVTTEPIVSTPNPSSSVAVTPTTSKISTTELDSSTPQLQPDQRTALTPSSPQSSITFSSANKLPLYIPIVNICVALAALVVMMY